MATTSIAHARSRSWLALAAGAVAVSVSSPSWGQDPRKEVLLRGPLASACALNIRRYSIPPRLEWAYFALGGASLGGGRASAMAGVGAELTSSLFTYGGLPSGDYGPTRGLAELKGGLWSNVATRAEGGLVEAGIKLQLGAIHHAALGTFDVRVGFGHAAFVRGQGAYGTGTLAWGLYVAPERELTRACEAPVPRPSWLGLASVARLFATYQRALDDANGARVLFGVELSASAFLPRHRDAICAGGRAEPVREQ